MKIAILSESFLIGGLETRLKSMTKYFYRNGHEVYLITQRIDGNAHSSLPFKTIYLANFNNTKSVKAALMMASPDVANIHPFSSIISGATACREIGIPYSITMHGIYMESRYIPYLQNADYVFAVSEEVKTNILQSIPNLKVMILNNGIDLEVFKPVDIGSKPNIAYVSRLDNIKIGGILQAANLIAQKQGARLHIIGNGQAENHLKQALPFVKFHGYVEDIAGYFQKNNGVYSTIGGMGRAIVEGMAMKMPVLVVSYDGVKGYVTPYNFHDFAKRNFSGRGMPNIKKLPDANKDYVEALYQLVCNEYNIENTVEDYLSLVSNHKNLERDLMTTKAVKTKKEQKTSKAKRIKNAMEKLSKIYDRDYFENGVATKKSTYTDYNWTRLGSYFQKTAKHIVDRFNPKSAFDVGCAKGFLVKALCELGVDAYGIDPSEYALKEAHPDIKERLTPGIAQSIPLGDNECDLVTCFDVLEHIPEKDVAKVLEEMLRVTKEWLILRLVTKKLPGDIDKNRSTIHDKEWWHKQIEKAGGVVEPVDNYVNTAVWWFNVPEFLIVARKAV